MGEIFRCDNYDEIAGNTIGGTLPAPAETKAVTPDDPQVTVVEQPIEPTQPEQPPVA